MKAKKLIPIVTVAATMMMALPTYAGRLQHNDFRDHDEDYAVTGEYKRVIRSERKFQRQLDRRQQRQLRRIENGIDAGELTRKEAKRLKRQQRAIARLEDKLHADDHYSRKDRRIMERKLDAASEDIYQAKHNDRVRHARRDIDSWDSNQDRGWRSGHWHLFGHLTYPGRGFPYWW